MSQTSISGCGRLNDDVLREIFTHCIIRENRYLDSYSNYSSQTISQRFVVAYYKPSIREHPQLSLSQVCSSWRDIALLTPQLWDNIWILDSTEANLSTAREYLSRAGNLPVSITIKEWTLTRQLRQDWRSQLTDFLSSYRIRTLELEVTEKMPRFHLPNLPQQSVAELESLWIGSHPDQEEAQIDLNDTRYPKLAVVRIRGAYKISSFSNSLRMFDGTGLSMTVIESWDLLSHCPSLEESWLWITRVNGSRRPVSMPQIHLQRLRILVLESGSGIDEIPFSTFIEALSLPVLEKLRLNGQATWSATAFRSLAQRSNYFPYLRTFYLADSTSIVDAGILLASMPRLKSIEICSCDAVDKVIFNIHARNMTVLMDYARPSHPGLQCRTKQTTATGRTSVA